MKDLLEKFILWFNLKVLKKMYTLQDVQPIVDLLNQVIPGFTRIDEFSLFQTTGYYELIFNYTTVHQVRFKIVYSNQNVGFFYISSGLISLDDLSMELVCLSHRLRKKEKRILIEFQTLLQSKHQPI